MKKKGKRFSGYWLLAGLLSLFGVFCLWETQCSAIEIIGTNTTEIQVLSVKGWIGTNQIVETLPTTSLSIGNVERLKRFYWNNLTSLRINELQMRIDPNYGNDTIMHLSLRFSKFSRGTSPLGFEGLRGASGSTVISRNCVEMQSIKKDYTDEVSFYQCDYWLYVDSGTNTLRLKGEIWVDGNESDFYLDVLTNVDVLTLSQGLSSADIDGLSDAITGAIADLEVAVESSGGATPAQIQNAAETAIENALEDEKEQYEEQQNDVSDGADDAGDAAEAATSSLISNTRNIIETIRDTPATNCNIRIQRGGFDTGNLNLCDVPQQIRTIISSIIVIPVTLAALHIAYTTVMLYLNTVRKEQE